MRLRLRLRCEEMLGSALSSLTVFWPRWGCVYCRGVRPVREWTVDGEDEGWKMMMSERIVCE